MTESCKIRKTVLLTALVLMAGSLVTMMSTAVAWYGAIVVGFIWILRGDSRMTKARGSDQQATPPVGVYRDPSALPAERAVYEGAGVNVMALIATGGVLSFVKDRMD